MEEDGGGDGAAAAGGVEVPIFRDIRRYCCEFCGLCRSKKSLITCHMLSNHQDEMKERGSEEDIEKEDGKKLNTCGECGASFRKPAHLRQHMQSHSAERPFTCPIDDCHSSYRRKDHLSRHLLQHQGKLFECPVAKCSRKFSYQGNLKRHMKEFHDKEPCSSDFDSLKKYVCPEVGCGKVFQYASKLQKHENSHVKLDVVEAFCSEPGCMKYFTNEKCLREHIHSCHLHITCEICGTKQLKKNIKRHLRIHEAGSSSERLQCSFKGCMHSFSKKSNLQQHVKAVHYGLKPFSCSFPGCGMRFSFKHVRDNHERSVAHVFSQGDFEDSDELFRSRPRGGRKRKFPGVETLLRKRVALTPPSEFDEL